MDDDVLGMPPEFVAELLNEGASAQEDLKGALRRVRNELSTRHLPSDDSIRRLEGIRDRLEDVNSSFEMTRCFLRKRGMTNVRELDEQGKAELTEHLKLVLMAVKAENVPT